MIRRATAADIPLIRKRLAELRNPPNYPDDEDIQRLIDDEVFFVDEEHEAISDWHRNDRLKTIRGRYVIGPSTMRPAAFIPLLAATWAECAQRWPDALGWRLEGDFEVDNEAKCEAYREALTTAGDGPSVDDSRADGAVTIWWRLGQAVDRSLEMVAHGP